MKIAYNISQPSQSLADLPEVYNGTVCHKMRCGEKTTGVLMTIRGLEFECPSGQQQLLTELPFDPPLETGSVMCPLWEELCSTSMDNAVGSLTCGDLNQCNDRGRCYKGVCYCFVGFTGMLQHLTEPVLTFSKLIKICFGYFDPENILLDNKNK